MRIRKSAQKVVSAQRDLTAHQKALLAATNVRYVTSEELRLVDPELRSFRNINTPADYEAWLTTQPSATRLP